MCVKKQSKCGFSLIELLIVVAILGALTAIILPQFNASEQDAKDAIATHNASGLMRTFKQFESLNGVFPTNMHSGLNDDGTDVLLVSDLPDALKEEICAMTLGGSAIGTYAAGGMGSPSTGTITSALPVYSGGMGSPTGYQDAMRKFGLKFQEYGEDISNPVDWEGNAMGGMTLGAAVEGNVTNNTPLVVFDGDVTLGGQPLTVHGKTMSEILGSSSVGVLLWVSPNTFTGMYQKSDTTDQSKWVGGSDIKLDDLPEDPTASSDDWPYYIAVFQVYGSTPPNTCELLTVLNADGVNEVNP